VLIDGDGNDDKDEAIHIVLSIDNADVEFEDIAVVLAPPPPLLYTGAVVPFLGGGCPLLTPNMLLAFESATIPPQKTACRLKRPHCRPCRCNQPRAPNHSNKAIPSHPQPMMGGTSTLTTTLLATSARVTNQCSLSPTLPRPVSYVGAVLSIKGGDCQPPFQVFQASTAHELAVGMLHWTAHQRKWPRCRPV
jgi:hypothetical protein